MKFEAVLFDCDGVLVDSEPLTNGVLRDMLAERGWELSVDECMRFFVGKAVMDEVATIEKHTGQPVTEAWMAEFRSRRNQALQDQLLPIPNIHAAVQAIHTAYAGGIACASGADRIKVELQLRKVGLIEYFDGRVFSGHEMPRSKPWPDVYLAAAAALQANPQRCAVVEDTVTGVRAGVAAGATVFGYSPASSGHVDAQTLREAGASATFTDMEQLAALLV
ncbi:haloacid dehalogenase superfamily, subfamily IA, variant 3 with third motif having DD or ED [Rhodoferax sp. OV413]|uniref:HAD family hydrolase n=1 Tax=Rhodoferax sp. OV413 TaxID=1855285 RepID=UPI0008859A99|nr:HAD family phosphatase [Rhodoferax sp. OV413]SDO93833.1 haloacid dehalogenase superfamily, subfamily IA, variant 3 with third motif having DD or ED [Rhodoferax sp. OV413]